MPVAGEGSNKSDLNAIGEPWFRYGRKRISGRTNMDKTFLAGFGIHQGAADRVPDG